MTQEIVTKLQEHELKLAELYGIYADLFPEHRDFWEELSLAEENHAMILADILKKVDNKTVSIDKTRFRERPLQISTGYIQEMIEKAQQGNLTLLSALSTANTMESAIIDGKFFEVFQGTAPWLKRYLQTLQQETKQHQASIKKKIEVIRRG